jgi:citrate lyase subunit beta/citryl-CoA lyase/(S)-citramalyl-CoA lyase
MYTRYCRSMLCTPAIAEERYARCHRSGADVCLVDLEDSVPPARKEEARCAAEAFFTGAPLPARRAIRINAVTEPDGLRDLLALRRYPVPPDIVLIPKVESARDVQIVDQVLGERIELVGVIESPRGVDRIEEIATASSRLRALIFGAADYAMTMGIGLSWGPLTYARSRLVNTARAANIVAIDSPTFDLADLALLRTEATSAQGLGFSGKVALHPRQVAVLNEIFSPDAARLDQARRILTAGQRSGQGITTVDGSMIGRPFFEESRRLLDEFRPPETQKT